MSTLDDIKTRLEAVEPGPWEVIEGEQTVRTGDGEIMFDRSGEGISYWNARGRRQAEFIAHAAETQAKLISALEAVEALHKPEKRWMPYRDADCSYDSAEEAAMDLSHSYTTDPSQMPYFEVCAHCKTIEDGVCEGQCTRENGYRESLWPCPTIKAITEALA